MNTGARLAGLDEAEQRVLHLQRKLHDWASVDGERRFHDVWNLVCDPATLLVAWSRVSQNRGSRTAGIDGRTRGYVEQEHGVQRFLDGLRSELKTGMFRPLPVRERLIPKRDGRMRRLGIPTLKDRVAQMALKLVLEPIFESGFYPSSYGYRPGRRAQDAIAEIVHFTKNPSNYEWVIEADIEACFDQLAHAQILGEVRRRVADKRVLALVRSFLRAGVMRETGRLERTVTGTPQGGIASPLLANIALSALDRLYEADWRQMNRHASYRQVLRRRGFPTYRLIRYADDLVIVVKGTRQQAEQLLAVLGERVASIGLQVKPEKTGITHIDEGFVFLGQRFIRRPNGHKRHVYTLVCDEALASIKRKIKALTGRSTRNLALADLLRLLNPVLRGWDRPPTRCVRGEPDAGELARPVRRAAARKPPAAKPEPAPRRRPLHRRHHRYLTSVADHKTGAIVWCAAGRNSATLQSFFEMLGDRKNSIKAISIDMSGEYQRAIRHAVPQAEICFDPFHVVRLAARATDQVRRDEWNRHDRSHTPEGRRVKGTRWSLLRAPTNQSIYQLATLAEVQRANRRLYRAFLLREELRLLYHLDDPALAPEHLDAWLVWATRSRLRPFVRLARTLRKHRAGILAAIRLELSNGRLEGLNSKIRLISHRAFGFHSADPLIALAYLCCAGLTIGLPR